MAKPDYPKIVCLSNVFDRNYQDLRGEDIGWSLSSNKRKVFFRCLQEASGREVILLSSPPRAVARRAPKWLPKAETRFAAQRQFFCANWDAPKLRVPLSWFFYARHVLRHVRSGDLVIIDNYEFIYVFAAWFLKLFRKVTFILDYEDGKHLIDRSFSRLLSSMAEAAGCPLLSGAIVAHPALGKRLPDSLPIELIPGFIPKELPPWPDLPATEVRFLYSGTLDHPRGVDLILESLKFLPEQGWHLDITGHGPLAEEISRFLLDARWREKVEYHQTLPPDTYERLQAACHVGLNCQRTSDPISGVTFPSKVFAYLSAGLVIISSKASEVDKICGNACLYYEVDAPQSLAAAMNQAITNLDAVRQKLDRTRVSERFSYEATMTRLQKFLGAVELSN